MDTPLHFIICILSITLLLSACVDTDTQSSPVFTSSKAISVAENTKITDYTAVATDDDGDVVTFSLSGGLDKEQFSIDKNSGILIFRIPPDYESPADSDTNNIYVVEISATDGTNVVSQSVVVTVIDEFDVNISTTDVKTVQFDWFTLEGASYYRLLVNPDGISGFTVLQDNITENTTTFILPVHLTDWFNSSYILEAHAESGKLDESSLISISSLMISSIGHVKSSNTRWGEKFGFAISLAADGNTLAIGVPEERSQATGINSDQVGYSGQDTGAVFVFSRTGTTWAQQAHIKASHPDWGDHFGEAVSLSSDGKILAVGAPYEHSSATGINGDETDNSAQLAGAVYVFNRTGINWTQQAYVKASNTDKSDSFGKFVSLSGDGNTLAVGAPYEDSSATGINGDETDNSERHAGAVYVFSHIDTTWIQQAYVKGNNTGKSDKFGSAVSLSGNGNTLAVGALSESSDATGIDGEAYSIEAASGAAYVFIRTNSAWTQQAYIKASTVDSVDLFGTAISLAADGNTLAVGARGEDSNATSINGDESDNSARDSGAVFVFSRKGITWTQQAYIKASNTDEYDGFGTAISLTSDGNTLAIGAPKEGSNATGINGDETNNSVQQTGAVYVFNRTDATWGQQTYVKASKSGQHQGWHYKFGSAVSLSGDGGILAVGTPGEDSPATGVNGNETDNSEVSFGSGAVYLF